VFGGLTVGFTKKIGKGLPYISALVGAKRPCNIKKIESKETLAGKAVKETPVTATPAVVPDPVGRRLQGDADKEKVDTVLEKDKNSVC